MGACLIRSWHVFIYVSALAVFGEADTKASFDTDRQMLRRCDDRASYRRHPDCAFFERLYASVLVLSVLVYSRS